MGRAVRIALVVAAAACALPPARAGELDGRLRLQVGQEFDSNARRVYGAREDSPADFLANLVFQGEIGYRRGAHRLALELHGGAKLFYQRRSEHLLATYLAGRWRQVLPGQRSFGVRLTLRDTTQAVHSRDYLLATGEVFSRRVFHPGIPIALEAFAGGRYFIFKPDHEADLIRSTNLGPSIGLRLSASFSPAWSAGLSYRFDTRFFDQPALAGQTGEGVLLGRDRQDERHIGVAQLRFQMHWWERHRLIVQTSYFLSFNDSNSLSSSALWHRLRLVLSMQLPWDLAVHLMGTVQYTDYLDGIYLESTAYEPDADENENAFAIRISWCFWRDLSLLLQAALYRNAFHSQEAERFQRETVMLGLAYGWSF
ncbi:MAG: hypothetical protein JXR96_18170 [Deltaproteobacteria bacterium]|nr:hypothetical protein [Deltaproteobacteria bacterium]